MNMKESLPTGRLVSFYTITTCLRTRNLSSLVDLTSGPSPKGDGSLHAKKLW